MAARLAPELLAENFQVGEVRSLPYEDSGFDLVITNAVLHFARDEGDFFEMLDETWRVLRPGGILFARLASPIGMEGRLRRLGAIPVEPLKSVIVQGQRSMTTWCLQKAPK